MLKKWNIHNSSKIFIEYNCSKNGIFTENSEFDKKRLGSPWQQTHLKPLKTEQPSCTCERISWTSWGNWHKGGAGMMGLLMAEIRRSPVEVGSWNPIIYVGFYDHPRWLALGFLPPTGCLKNLLDGYYSKFQASHFSPPGTCECPAYFWAKNPAIFWTAFSNKNKGSHLDSRHVRMGHITWLQAIMKLE